MSATRDICAPLEQTEGTRAQVLRWLKRAGDAIGENEPLVEIETDKVTVEVAAPAAGVLREIVKGEHEPIEPGEVLARMEVLEVSPDSRAPAQTSSPASDVASASVRRIPHAAARKRIAEHMMRSLRLAPHVTSVFEASLSAVMAHRATHQTQFHQRGVPLTYTAYFLAAAVQALRAVPEANSRWTQDALEIYDAIHIGVATALGNSGGLIVPVVRDAQSKDLFEIAQELNEKVTAAHTGKLQPADVRGGTFTVSNHGVSGSLLAAPIVIHQPQSAILGIGKVEKRPVVMEENGVERVVIQPRCYVTLTIDHRVMDGQHANRFLQVFVKALETWPAQ